MMMMYDGYVIGGEQSVKNVNPESNLVDRKMQSADIDQIGGGVVHDHDQGNDGVSPRRHQQHTNCFPQKSQTVDDTAMPAMSDQGWMDEHWNDRMHYELPIEMMVYALDQYYLVYTLLVQDEESEDHDRLDGCWDGMNEINVDDRFHSEDDDVPLGDGESVGVQNLEKLNGIEVWVQDDG